MERKIAFIGGSGVYQLDKAEIVQEHHVETPFGQPSDAIIETKIEGISAFFLARHARGHKYLPHEVNYCANIYALKSLGIEHIISISAVGSLREEFAPGHFVLADQFIDWTKGKRKRTFFGDGVVAHISNANPVDKKLQNLLFQSCKNAGVTASLNGTYLCIEGPQFSTRAESHLYKNLGASVIGMTNVPEAFLAKEAGMSYATMAMVTDFDAWKEEHCTVEEIMKVMKENNKNAQKVLVSIAHEINSHGLPKVTKENAAGVMSDLENISEDRAAIMKVLLK
jgi:5'-methylthioadenosine phosphorylase